MTEPSLGGDQEPTRRPGPAAATRAATRATSTSNFGVSKRENHDATDFYARFTPPILSSDATVNPYGPVDWIHCGDARRMDERIKPNSVALVVTSPPYFAGKAYEEELGEGHIPADYIEYLAMLRDVFAACVDKLEPGGRIAVNVANLGRKPYRSLGADIVRILQDDLGMLLRGEIIWRKAEGSTGSCAWGSFRSASNPVLRDLTERVVVASKGRFDRAIDKRTRAKRGLPHEDTILKDDFMDWTTDVWDIGTESAQRVGHPAPYPVELPQRLIELYTYRGDLVLDPFMGSGSTAVAAVRTHRHYVGFDTDDTYVKAARDRVAGILDERESGGAERTTRPWRFVAPSLPAGTTPPAPKSKRGKAAPTDDTDDLEIDADERALAEGWMAKELALHLLTDAGFTVTNVGAKGTKPVRRRPGIDLAFTATDRRGNRWLFDLVGALTRGNDRAGLRPTDAVLRALGKATVLQGSETEPYRLVLLATELPARSTPAAGELYPPTRT